MQLRRHALLAWLTSPVEQQLLDDWLDVNRRRHPDADVDVLTLPAAKPSADVVDRLSALLHCAQERTLAADGHSTLSGEDRLGHP